MTKLLESRLESERLRALQEYGVMDTAPEPAFDDLAALAASICGTPVALVTLVGRDHQWFKAHHGLPLEATPLDVSFCRRAIASSRETLVVPDAKRDARFAENPFVTGEPGIRFYAGVPLCTPEGFALGTLCVIDREPRELRPDQLANLRVLANQTMSQLELRRSLAIATLDRARLANVQRIAGLGDWDFDFTTGRLHWSDELYRILDFARGPAAPDSEMFYARVHPDDVAFVRREKRAAADGARRVDFVHRIVRPSGEVRFIHQIAETRCDDDGRPVRETGTLQDITDRRFVDDALRESEARYRLLLMESPDAQYLHVDEVITLVNPAMCRLLGAVHPDQLLGKRVRDIVPPEFHEQVRLRSLAVLGGQRMEPIERRYRRLDGSSVEAEVNSVACDFGGRKEVHVIVRDLSVRRVAEAALRDSELRFKLVARAVSDVVWDWDLATDSLWWSDGFGTTFGFASDEIEPSIASWTNRIHPEERTAVLDGIHRAIDTGRESWNADYRFCRRDGSYAFVHDRGYILRDAAGQGVRMVGGIRDLTEQKKLEAQLLRAQRMESIGTLAGGIAHDLNNVLAPIMLSIELLKLDAGADPQRREVLEVIHLSSRRGADLVRQVLQFARGLDGARVAIPLRALVTDLERIVRETFPRNIRFVFEVPRGLWVVMGDPTHVHQVLLNLMVNARDAMPAGGTITVSAANVTLDESTAGAGARPAPGTHVRLRVSDTGQGIAPEIRERIFEPFFTTKEVGKGTGLGLATVHTVVKDLGGFVTVESELGRGSTFTIHLPADALRPRTATAVPLEDHHPRGKGELVLVVDDEFSIRHITQQTLETFGYRVLTAADGAEGLAVFNRHAQEVDVVVTDMMMPTLDGPSTIEQIRRHHPGVRILAASGIESGDTLATAIRAGADDFLLKPYTARTLLVRLRAILERPVGG